MTDEEIADLLVKLDRIEWAGLTDESCRTVRRLCDALTAARRARDEARMLQASAEEEMRRVRVDLAAAIAERDEAEQRGRAAERRRMRAAVEQMMADAVHEAADARQQCVDHGETRIRLDDRARASGRIDTCEAVLEMLDGRHVGAAGKNGGGE